MSSNHTAKLYTFFGVFRTSWTFASSCWDRTRLVPSDLRRLPEWGTCQIWIFLSMRWQPCHLTSSSPLLPSEFWTFPWIVSWGSLPRLLLDSDNSCFSTWTITGHNHICHFICIYIVQSLIPNLSAKSMCYNYSYTVVLVVTAYNVIITPSVYTLYYSYKY